MTLYNFNNKQNTDNIIWFETINGIELPLFSIFQSFVILKQKWVEFKKIDGGNSE